MLIGSAFFLRLTGTPTTMRFRNFSMRRRSSALAAEHPLKLLEFDDGIVSGQPGSMQCLCGARVWTLRASWP